MINKYFEISDEVLAEGGFSKLYLGRHRESGVPVAIKVIANDTLITKSVYDEFEREIYIQMRLRNNEHILKLFGFVFDQDHAYLIMEFAPGGTLLDYINEDKNMPVAESQVKKFVLMIMDGLEHIYEKDNGVSHRDLKPENLLFGANGELKLADFGLAAKFNSKSVRVCQGTAGYMPPEVYDGIKQDPIKADCFALGCIVYMLLTGEHPFDPQGKLGADEIQAKIRGEAYNWSSYFEGKHNYKISDQAKRFVAKLLKPKQEDRYNLKMARKDEWLSSD